MSMLDFCGFFFDSANITNYKYNIIMLKLIWTQSCMYVSNLYLSEKNITSQAND